MQILKFLALKSWNLFKIIMKIIYQPSLALPTMKAEKNKKRHLENIRNSKNKKHHSLTLFH